MHGEIIGKDCEDTNKLFSITLYLFAVFERDSTKATLHQDRRWTAKYIVDPANKGLLAVEDACMHPLW